MKKVRKSPRTVPGDASPETDYIFSDETFAALARLGAVLRKVHAQMVREGYTVLDGECVTLEEYAKRKGKRTKYKKENQTQRVP